MGGLSGGSWWTCWTWCAWCLWCAVCETLETRLPSVFHGLNSQFFLDSCRLFLACLAPFNPRGTRSAGVLHMLTRWTLHGSKLATCAKLAALRPSVFHGFSTIKKSLIVAIWCIFCQIWHADGVEKCLFWNCSSVFLRPLALEPCVLRDFFYFFSFFFLQGLCNRDILALVNGR